ncbi:MAG: hypothetical protein ABIJ92_03535 [Candidatus Aenigmatarchaeota archaeon]
MKWHAISGSWRQVNSQVKKDVEGVVRIILQRGEGIVAGGALGVDYCATRIVLEMNRLNQIKIYLPIKLSDYCKHYLKRAQEGVITEEHAHELIHQLEEIYRNNPKAIFDESRFTEANKESYYARNTMIIENCSILHAFHVNKSKGVQDAIDKAKRLGKETIVKEYTI